MSIASVETPGPKQDFPELQNQLRGEDVLPGFACRVAELFAGI